MDEYISNFIVDAQYKIAELTELIRQKKNDGGDLGSYKKEYLLRLEISEWLSILYEARMDIRDDYNFINAVWDEAEIKAECEYLRALSEMSRIPYISFATYSPEIIVQQTGGGGEASLPAGSQGQLITYDAGGNPVVEDPPDTGGMGSLTIDQYFN